MRKITIDFDLSGYEYPKSNIDCGQDGVIMYFPYIMFDDSDGEEIAHPIFAHLNSGGKVTSVEVHNNWTDDHALWFNATIGVDNKLYGISFQWVENEWLIDCVKAGCGVDVDFFTEALLAFNPFD